MEDIATICSKEYPTTIHLSSGTFNEIQIKSVAGMTIKGGGASSTTIETDGSRSVPDPGTGKSGMTVIGSVTVKDLTWYSYNSSSAYCIHMDTTGDVDLSVVNCVLKNDFHPIGIGIRGGQTATLSGCELRYTGSGSTQGLYCHNTASQSAPASITMNNCDCYGCSVVQVYEMGSGQSDTFISRNCTTDDLSRGIELDASDASVPYCWQITQCNGTMPAFFTNPTTRPDGDDYYTYYTYGNCSNEPSTYDVLTASGEDLVDSEGNTLVTGG